MSPRHRPERRLLLVANTLPPRDISGVGEQVLQLAAGLRQRGFEVRVLGRGAGGARGPKVLFPLTVVPALLRALWSFRPHVVQVHESDGGLAALAVVAYRSLLRRRGAIRLVALLQVSYRREILAVRPLLDRGRIVGRPGKVERRFRRWKGPLQVLLGRWSARLADRVLAPSRRTAQELGADYGIPEPQVLPNVTGGLEVTPEPVAGGRAGEGAFFLFVGRLRVRKGLEVLMAALGIGAERAEAEAAAGPEVTSPQARLLVAGDGEHREALEAAAVEGGLADRVGFLGRCSAGQVRTLLAEARALVVPSIYEGMPLVILEAMEAEVPVVASAVSGIPEVVVAGETGWIVPAEDAAALAAALAEVLEDPREAARRGRAGKRRLEERYRPSHAAGLWETQVCGAPAEEDIEEHGDIPQ